MKHWQNIAKVIAATVAVVTLPTSAHAATPAHHLTIGACKRIDRELAANGAGPWLRRVAYERCVRVAIAQRGHHG